MLQDMVTAAVSQAVKKSKELHESEMKKLTSAMGIPPGFF